MLVEVTTVDELVEKMKKGKYRSSSDVQGKSKYLRVKSCLSILTVPSSSDRNS